jgi:hypothetical protein
MEVKVTILPKDGKLLKVRYRISKIFEAVRKNLKNSQQKTKGSF